MGRVDSPHVMFFYIVALPRSNRYSSVRKCNYYFFNRSAVVSWINIDWVFPLFRFTFKFYKDFEFFSMHIELQSEKMHKFNIELDFHMWNLQKTILIRVNVIPEWGFDFCSLYGKSDGDLFNVHEWVDEWKLSYHFYIFTFGMKWISCMKVIHTNLPKRRIQTLAWWWRMETLYYRSNNIIIVGLSNWDNHKPDENIDYRRFGVLT